MAVRWSGWMRYLIGGLWNPDIGVQWPGPMGGGNDAMQPVTDERALAIGAVFRSIRIIAETCAALPMHGYQKSSNGDLSPLNDSHWLNGLIEEPNEEMAGDEWRETQFAAMAGWGNAYSQTPRQSEGRVVEIWPYKVDRMQVERMPDLRLRYQYPNQFGVPQTLERTRVMHYRAFSLDGVMGLSPLGMARHALGLAIGTERYAASFYASGGRPSGVMTVDKVLTESQREQVRKEYGGMADGGNDKRFWLLEGPLKYQPISVNPEDMQMLQTRVFTVADIARFFGVPLFLLMEGEKSSMWGTGLEQMNLGFLTYTLLPYLQRMTVTFNRTVIPKAERGKICAYIDDKALLRLDAQAAKDLYGAYATNGIMSRNEIRRILRLPQSNVQGMSSFTAQSALTTVENLGRVPTAPPGTSPVGG